MIIILTLCSKIKKIYIYHFVEYVNKPKSAFQEHGYPTILIEQESGLNHQYSLASNFDSSRAKLITVLSWPA